MQPIDIKINSFISQTVDSYAQSFEIDMTYNEQEAIYSIDDLLNSGLFEEDNGDLSMTSNANAYEGQLNGQDGLAVTNDKGDGFFVVFNDDGEIENIHGLNQDGDYLNVAYNDLDTGKGLMYGGIDNNYRDNYFSATMGTIDTINITDVEVTGNNNGVLSTTTKVAGKMEMATNEVYSYDSLSAIGVRSNAKPFFFSCYFPDNTESLINDVLGTDSGSSYSVRALTTDVNGGSISLGEKYIMVSSSDNDDKFVIIPVLTEGGSIQHVYTVNTEDLYFGKECTDCGKADAYDLWIQDKDGNINAEGRLAGDIFNGGTCSFNMDFYSDARPPVDSSSSDEAKVETTPVDSSSTDTSTSLDLINDYNNNRISVKAFVDSLRDKLNSGTNVSSIKADIDGLLLEDKKTTALQNILVVLTDDADIETFKPLVKLYEDQVDGILNNLGELQIGILNDKWGLQLRIEPGTNSMEPDPLLEQETQNANDLLLKLLHLNMISSLDSIALTEVDMFSIISNKNIDSLNEKDQEYIQSLHEASITDVDGYITEKDINNILFNKHNGDSKVLTPPQNGKELLQLLGRTEKGINEVHIIDLKGKPDLLTKTALSEEQVQTLFDAAVIDADGLLYAGEIDSLIY
ncbi:hypothetical protein ACFL4D_02840 [Candidatus Margulisiibacteriota bacterium]